MQSEFSIWPCVDFLFIYLCLYDKWVIILWCEQHQVYVVMCFTVRVRFKTIIIKIRLQNNNK